MNQINKGILLIWTKISPSYLSYLTNPSFVVDHEAQWSDKAHFSTSRQKKIPKPYYSRTMAQPPDAPTTKSWLHLVAPRAMETPAPPLRHRGSTAQLGAHT